MAKIKKNKSSGTSSSIITIDPYSNTSYKFSANELTENDLKRSSFKKSSFFISYVMAKDIVFGTIEISRSVLSDDLQDALEIKAYEDLGLDSSINYKINYVETISSINDQKNYVYDVFAVNSDILTQSFSYLKGKLSYVDYITTAPMLISALYKKSIIDQRGGAECFIYFQKNDAFLAIYQNGRYLYSKSLRYSLKEINERFCSLMGERVDEEIFFDILKKDGLNTSNIKYQQQFMKLFGEVFLYINDIAVYGKRYCSISQIDRVYIGTEIGSIIGMNEYAKSYMGLEAHDFNFSIAINTKEEYVDQIHVMMVLAAQSHLEFDSEKAFNFTIFKRPDPLSKRPAGIFLGAVVAGLAAGLIYPVFNYGFGFYSQVVHEIKNKEYQEKLVIANDMRGQIASLQQDYDVLKSNYDTESNLLMTREGLLKEIKSKRVDYKMKGVIISDLVSMVNKNNVKLKNISQTNNTVILSLVSQNEKNITELIDEIAAIKDEVTETQRYTIRTKTILKNSNTSRYESNISMEAL
ncbi:MAG: hypothetical protein LBG21_05805 [Campylobacteraceae bacterium]|jgi:hypothetical protein|nr:hypothetical protein [Campylobacteraceae bacterium]